MTRIVVTSKNMSGLRGFGGSLWVRLQYVLGLRRLGVESYWIDHLDAIDPVTQRMDLDYVVQRFERLLRDFGLEKHYCIVYDLGEKHFGMTRDELGELAKEAVLLMNLSGTPEPESRLHRMSMKAYFDLDPAFSQMWATGE